MLVILEKKTHRGTIFLWLALSEWAEKWRRAESSTFHPVTLNVFPALPIVTVLSHIPGKVASDEIKQDR